MLIQNKTIQNKSNTVIAVFEKAVCIGHQLWNFSVLFSFRANQCLVCDREVIQGQFEVNPSKAMKLTSAV